MSHQNQATALDQYSYPSLSWPSSTDPSTAYTDIKVQRVHSSTWLPVPHRKRIMELTSQSSLTTYSNCRSSYQSKSLLFHAWPMTGEAGWEILVTESTAKPASLTKSPILAYRSNGESQFIVDTRDLLQPDGRVCSCLTTNKSAGKAFNSPGERANLNGQRTIGGT